MLGFLKRRRVDPRAELRKAVGDYELPSFPGVVLETLKAIRHPEASAPAVAGVISSDPGLSVRLLSLANSAQFASARRVESVDKAVAMLGLASVESMVLSIGVQQALPQQTAPGFDPRSFWLAAARRALTAQAFAEVIAPATRSISFTASLLQDMAVPLLAHRRSGYGDLLEAWHLGGENLDALERAEFGWDHARVATWLCNEWELPEGLAEAIGGHHESDEELNCPQAVALVSLLREHEEHPGIDQLVEVARARHGLSADRSVQLVRDSFERSDDLVRLFV